MSFDPVITPFVITGVTCAARAVVSQTYQATRASGEWCCTGKKDRPEPEEDAPAPLPAPPAPLSLPPLPAPAAPLALPPPPSPEEPIIDAKVDGREREPALLPPPPIFAVNEPDGQGTLSLALYEYNTVNQAHTKDEKDTTQFEGEDYGADKPVKPYTGDGHWYEEF